MLALLRPERRTRRGDANVNLPRIHVDTQLNCRRIQSRPVPVRIARDFSRQYETASDTTYSLQNKVFIVMLRHQPRSRSGDTMRPPKQLPAEIIRR